MRAKKVTPQKQTRRSTKTASKSHSQPAQKDQPPKAWIFRADALDLLVATAARMPGALPNPNAEDLIDALDETGQHNLDPLALHANSAMQLIDLCEQLLQRRHIEISTRKAMREHGSAVLQSHAQVTAELDANLRDFLGEPQKEEGRFSLAQVRLLLTGHKAANRGDSALQKIWMDSVREGWLPKSLEPFAGEDRSKDIGEYVESKGLANWQLRILVGFATRLGKRKMPATILASAGLEGELDRSPDPAGNLPE